MKKILSGKNRQINWVFYRCEKKDLPIKDSVKLYPNHFGKVRIVGETDTLIKTDGLLTDQKKTLIMKTADCVPIIVWWPDEKWIGILHFGYRGLIFNLANNFLKIVREKNLDIKEAKFLLGPAICQNCYTHTTFIRKIKWGILKFKHPKFSLISDKKYRFDLVGASITELLRIGVKAENIEQVRDHCTNCKLGLSRHYKIKDATVLTTLDRI